MQETVDDPMPDFTCPSAHKARMICSTETCQAHSFSCLREDCEQCQKNHKFCQLYRVNALVEQLRGKLQKANPQVVKACEKMKGFYDVAIERISYDKELIGGQMELYGLNQHEACFYRLLKDQRLSQVTGKVAFKALEAINEKLQLNITEEGVSRFWQKKKKHFNEIFDNFKLLLKKKFTKLESKVTDQISIIQGFFDNPIYEYKLLYRASEHNYQVSTFHNKCDGVANTLVLAKTEFGKVIGAFTPLKWNSSGSYVNGSSSDTPKTFLFSVTLNQKYQVMVETSTIYGNAGYGPTFGGGHDFYIANTSSTSQTTSYFNFPNSYNLNGKYVAGQESYQAFTGQTSGYYAKIVEWQVYQLQFF